MFKAKTVRTWYKIHKWTSLICTVFLLLLCLTGLPLIFHHELDHLLGNTVEPPPMPAGTPLASLDAVVEAGRKLHPDLVLQYLSWDPDEPNVVSLSMGTSPKELAVRFLTIDARTAEVLKAPKVQEGLMYILLRLHVDLFAGIPGKLFLGLMGLLFVASIVSGAVVYGPFMRNLDFGTVRTGKAARVTWFDLHSLFGIVTLMWAIVVGATGVINTWADLVVRLWQFDQLAEMTAPYRNRPAPAKLASLERAVAVARQAAPGMVPAFVAFPGTDLTSNHHYGVFMHGATPLTARLYKPVLVDAQTGELTDTRDLPWYVTALLVSQPLHFGDYGGLPLKILWALLDVVTIVVLISGLYLWIARRKSAIEERIEALALRAEELA